MLAIAEDNAYWAPHSPCIPLLKQLDLSSVLIYSGLRHVEPLFEIAESITFAAMDPRHARETHGLRPNTTFVSSAGCDLRNVPSVSHTAAVSYGALWTHSFTGEVLPLVRDLRYVLVGGGRALLHYGLGERNEEYERAKAMERVTQTAGFKILDHLRWRGDMIVDALILIECA